MSGRVDIVNKISSIIEDHTFDVAFPIYKNQRVFENEDLPLCCIYCGDEVFAEKAYDNTKLELDVNVGFIFDIVDASEVASRVEPIIQDVKDLLVNKGVIEIDAENDFSLKFNRLTFDLPDEVGQKEVFFVFNFTATYVF